MLRRPALESAASTPAQVDKARRLLESALGPSKVLTGAEDCARFGGDESDQEAVTPHAVVLAESAGDIVKALAVASAAEVPVTPRAAGSGKSGGCVPLAGGIVLATLGMDHIVEIDREEGLVVVEPGVVLADLHAAVEAEGWFYPPDPNSASWCALGGNIAENAAGPRAFKYGSTRDYVLGLDVVTMAGERLSVGRRTKKGVTGYDLTALLVGSEGTLAVTARATLHLIPKPEAVATLLALFARVEDAARAVSALIAAGLVPRCIELLDPATLEAVRAHGVAVDATARAMLIIEVDGDEHSVERAMERVGEACMGAQAMDVLVAQDEAQRSRLWEARRQLSPTTRKMARFKISEDVVVPRRRVADLIDEVARIAEATQVRLLTYGHAGDGNLHVNFLWNEPEQVTEVERGLAMLFRAVVAMGGTLTGEHGVGASKRDYLALEQSAELIALQRRVKALFDPKGLLNPGKIFPTMTHGAC